MSALVCIATTAAASLLLSAAPSPAARAAVARAPAPVCLIDEAIFDSPLPEALDEDAAAILEEADGDIEKARMSYIGYTLAYLEEAMPELYQQLRTGSDKNGPDAPEAHAALVEITWDAIAAFMPITHSSRPSQEAAKRLTAISRVALPAGGATSDTSVLDVGCGNGLLVPFLGEIGLPLSNYRGIDLSSRMVDLAERAHGATGAVFEDLSFADEGKRDVKYESIIFNGALQFFDDQPATLRQAAAMLSDSDEARIVVSHVSGASFVRREMGDNPTTVRNTMPFLEMMQDVAKTCGLQVVLPSFLGTEVEEIEKNLERFYLLVLRKATPDDEEDGEDGASGKLELPDAMVDTSIRLD